MGSKFWLSSKTPNYSSFDFKTIKFIGKCMRENRVQVFQQFSKEFDDADADCNGLRAFCVSGLVKIMKSITKEK